MTVQRGDGMKDGRRLAHVRRLHQPSPTVDHFVDQSSECELLSFMNAHSGYNQVSMAREDKEKISFITEMVTFCFKVMSFGLRNAIRYLSLGPNHPRPDPAARKDADHGPAEAKGS